MLITKSSYDFSKCDLPWINIKKAKPFVLYSPCLVLYESKEYYGSTSLEYCLGFYNGENFVKDNSPFGPNEKLNFPVVAYLPLADKKKPVKVDPQQSKLF